MNNFKLKTVIFAALLSASFSAAACRPCEPAAIGRIVSISEEVRLVNYYSSRPVCEDREVGYGRYVTRRERGGHPVVGATVGGLIGSTIGGGRGRVAMAIVGAATGAAIGNHRYTDNRYDNYPIVETHCSERQFQTTRREVTGYNITYYYDGYYDTYFSKTYPRSQYIQLESSHSYGD